MDQHPQQLDLEALVDWLADETQQYTKAFSSKNTEALLRHKNTIDVLIAEIKRRKRDDLLPPQVVSGFPPRDLSETTP